MRRGPPLSDARQEGPAARGRRGLRVVALAVVCGWTLHGPVAPVRAQDEPESTDAGPADGVFLPGDRIRERQFDRGRDLLATGRWSDAAALFDEILAAERDAFLRGTADDATRRSLKAEASRVMQGQPAPGREAYELLFGPRAERALAAALTADDTAGVVAVARRWFHTPAGRRAALIAAFTALEADQPALAASWLERIATTPSAAQLEPTLSLMRGLALHRSGDAEAAVDILCGPRPREPVRVGGSEAAPSMTRPEALAWLDGMDRGRGRVTVREEWCQTRGVPARNPVVTASRPLLVPRYRVPLTRHPEEVRLLERQRRSLADAGLPPMPAGTALAVGGMVVVRTGLGILAIDFESGKRVWLQSAGADAAAVPLDSTGDGGAADTGPQATLARIFDDATSGGLAAADGLVFAIESPAEALLAGGQAEFGGFAGNGFLRGSRRTWQGGNRLVAYDTTARGKPRWRLPRGDGGPRSGVSTTWYLGAPLVAGHELYVLAEEKGEIRLDVLDPATGTTLWSQPLAELDVEHAITSPLARPRRLAGLSPALADGVLVCPIGTGTVVAIDIATRTLLWSYRYQRSARGDDEASGRARMGGIGGMGPGAGAGDRPETAAVDSVPVIANGRVLVAPYDGAELVCLDLREGAPVWQETVRSPAIVLGATPDRAVVLVHTGIEARSLANGRLLWKLAHDAIGGRPSGRGILTADRLLLPCDTPEVVEISLADGSIAARCPARGGAVPGNLVAYRGEIISHAVDSLDVFHQSATLESRIETARRADPRSPWALEWEGQLDLERGDVARGLEKLRSAAGATAFHLPPSTLAEAVVFGLRRDFAAASASWRDALRPDLAATGGPPAAARHAVRAAIDGFLRAGDLTTAWAATRELLATAGDQPGEPTLVRDPADTSLTVEENRWIAGRLAQLAATGGADLRAEIAEVTRRLVDEATVDGDPRSRSRRLHGLVTRLGLQPAGLQARAALVEALAATGAEEGALRRDLQRTLLTVRDGPAAPAAIVPAEAPDGPWPLGAVVARRSPGHRAGTTEGGRRRWLPPRVVADLGDGPRGLRLAVDLHDGRISVFDDLGRHVSDLALPALSHGQGPLHPQGGLWMPPAARIDVSALGRLLFIHAGPTVSAIDLGDPQGGGRPLWSRVGTARPVPVLGWGRAGGGRIARNGAVPLGMRITEPGGFPRGDAPRGARVTAQGVLHHDGTSLMLLDHADGAVLWERHVPHAISELVCDDDFVCACTPDGDGSTVLALIDGRVVHSTAVPHRRQRIGVSGRRILAIVQRDGGPAGGPGDPVLIESLDPVTREREVLGEFPGLSRTVMDGTDGVNGSGRLVVLAPDGTLTVLDSGGGGPVFTTNLPEMPARFEHLHVVTTPRLYLVVAGTPDAGAMEQATAAPFMGLADEMTPPLSGAIWAVERSSGALLWPAPATIERHAVPLHQPGGLPILTLVRRHSERDPARTDVTCLDVRTGHAVFHQDASAAPQGPVPGASPGFGGVDVQGNPDDGTVTLTDAGTGRRTELAFTGGPIPPQPPFRVTVRPAADGPALSAPLRDVLAPIIGPPR
jgi:outer membrane protein assembly factor BamB